MFDQQDQYFNTFIQHNGVEVEIILQYNGLNYSIYMEECESGKILEEDDIDYTHLEIFCEKLLDFSIPSQEQLRTAFNEWEDI